MIRAPPSNAEGLFACSGAMGYFLWITMLPPPNSVAASLASDSPGVFEMKVALFCEALELIR